MGLGSASTGLNAAAAIPGPQQPFVGGAAALTDLASMFSGSGNSQSSAPVAPAPIPQRPMSAAQPTLASPVSSTSVAPTGSIMPWQSGQNMPPALMQLIARLTGGKGTV